MQDEIAYGVHAEHRGKIVRIDDVAARLAHLLAALQQPRVRKDVIGQRLAQRHQEDGPVDGVEAGDVLADDVQLLAALPVLLVQLARIAVRVVPETGDIVGERVQPDVDDMAAVKVDGNAPCEGGARDAQILQPLL